MVPVSAGQSYAKYHISAAAVKLECQSRYFQAQLLYMFLIKEEEKTAQAILNSLVFLDNQVFFSRFNWKSTPVYHYRGFFMTFLLKAKV